MLSRPEVEPLAEYISELVNTDHTIFAFCLEMAVCSALNCHNTVRKGFVLVRFPKDTSLREEWISWMGRKGWSPNVNNRLCEVHFEHDQWEKYKHRLKDGAVPTLFCSCEQEEAMEQQTTDLLKNLSEYTDQISDHQYSKKRAKLQSNMQQFVLGHPGVEGESSQTVVLSVTSGKLNDCSKSRGESMSSKPQLKKTRCSDKCICKQPHQKSCLLYYVNNNELSQTGWDYFFDLLEENVVLKETVSRLKSKS